MKILHNASFLISVRPPAVFYVCRGKKDAEMQLNAANNNKVWSTFK